ncbi:FAD-binding oxidoreductase [Halomonas campisalis]|uniref:FAD-binding oxidoreductase n=1 Tax=Billgrantia campisalis TaxID=74661 RepID=A0ABS9P868_9GAMM|nr:FAD-binding oxidoreductase [Halomonas campisalis]MCG6657979.1 FAD-binding oxidoreductase [Halomonas campisalis]MDR5863496.1 FAD-binding oxidoreductase [Halomonas campisalis]
MRAITLEGREIDLTPEVLNGLQAQLQGPLLMPDDPDYEAPRRLWNAMIDRRPALVARCLGVADVMACVRFAREHDLLLCIKGGGHNIAGLAVADGALMLDLSLMRGVWVDRDRRVAHAQAGCVLGDVDRETQVHGLATVLGFISTTGIAGLTLGGGFGYLTRRWGYTTDNVLGMDVVTADGQLVHASAEENPDLFWALRGGGGNFGVVTGFDYRLYPVGPEVVGGVVAWPASEAPAVLELYRRLAEEAPPELTLVALMRPAPPAPWLPKEYHGEPIVALLACHSGDPEAGEAAVAPIKGFGEPIGDVLVRRPYAQMQKLLDATQPKGRRYYWKSEYLPGIEPALCEKAIEHAGRIRSPHSAVILFQLGGALNQLDNDHSPVGNRDARYVFNAGGAWEQPEDDEANIAWAREAWQDLKAFSTGGAYINFQTEDEGPERMEAALGPALERLAEIKHRWDPDNRFRVNRNIPPARTGPGQGNA